ncbi:MAG: 30S ribosomal protein S16 [Candidatus Curtissbacteria bacterium]|nr:30S ribosomal protein S16 [Candidatus Curtissbacteria bacterium]
MLKIRLMRIGAKKKPFYRVVAVDEQSKRTGAYIELLGTYNPLTEPKDIKLKQDRIDYWIKQGAQMSTGYLRIIGKAPQRPPRKPKKEKKTEEPVKEAVVEEIAKSDETVIPSDSEESLTNVSSDQPASAGDPSAPPQDDNKKESEKKDEGSA